MLKKVSWPRSYGSWITYSYAITLVMSSISVKSMVRCTRYDAVCISRYSGFL